MWRELLFLSLAIYGRGMCQAPHIVFIVADDLGWNDVGYHNPDMLTPNIDQLAREGVILDQSYVQPLCTPSRHAFMTGVYPFKAGLQHIVITPSRPVCSPLNYTMLPQQLKNLGYATHMVGKWHLGACKWECTPTERGFDSFFGYHNAVVDHYLHTDGGYFDYWFNKRAVPSQFMGEYNEHVFTRRAVDIIEKHNESEPLFLYLAYQNPHEPTEVPKIYEDKFPNILNKGRRVLAGMMNVLDEGIGKVVDALKENDLFNDTLILFTSDNGGELYNHGSNWPLRGGKFSLWEGGTRGTGFLYGAGLKKTGYTYKGMIHAVDWSPTLVAAAGGTPVAGIDGINQWDAISTGTASKRTEFVYNLDDLLIPVQGQAAIRMGNYKLLLGYPGRQDGWHRPMNHTEDDIYMTPIFDYDYDQPQLYNVIDDPREMFNIAGENPAQVAKMKARLAEYRRDIVPANFPAPDDNSDPRKFGNTWTPGWC